MMNLFKFVLLGTYIMLHVFYMIIHKIVHSSSCIHRSIVRILLPMQLQLYYINTLSLDIHYFLVCPNLIPIYSIWISVSIEILNNPGVTLLTLCHCTRV